MHSGSPPLIKNYPTADCLFLQVCEKLVKNQFLKYLHPFSKFCYFAIEFKTKIL